MIKISGVLGLLLAGFLVFLFLWKDPEMVAGIGGERGWSEVSGFPTDAGDGDFSDVVSRAGDPAPDGPRRTDKLGRVLPFRESGIAADWVDRLAGVRSGGSVTLRLFPDAVFSLLEPKTADAMIEAPLAGGGPRDRLILTRSAGGLRGFLEIPSRNLAYGIEGPEGGPLKASEWLFTDIVCAAPVKGGGAVAGLPRSRLVRPAAVAGPITPDQLPTLNTNLGATAVIHMDFDGETVAGSVWSSGSITVPPARLTVSQIEEVIARMDRDFEPFEVNITTDRAVYEAAPLDRRIHCIVTADDTAYPGAGGVAYVDSFIWDDPGYKVCWVFEDTDAKSTAEAASHEVGHTLGLRHDGLLATSTLPREEYYEGHGSGDTGWAPIMGIGYYKRLTQWSRGEYNRANRQEDDLAIISAATRLPYRADDRGNSPQTAASVSGSSAVGLIERNTDADLFRLELPSGSHTLRVTPAAFTNLDARLEILDSSGSILQVSDPAETLAASATISLSNDSTVFLKITSSGKGDVLGTGYSNYGSLGRYTVSGFGDQRQPPSVPVGLSLRRLSGSILVASWQGDESAFSYEIRRDGVLIAATANTSFTDEGATPSTLYSYTVRALNAYGSSSDSPPSLISTMAADEFAMDGAADFAGYKLYDSGMTIFAAGRGTRLYVATWSPGNDNSGFGSDHHIFVSDQILESATTPAPWEKRGLIAIPPGKPYLAGESSSAFAGWFETRGSTTLSKSPVNSGVLEGSIDLVAEFGSVPEFVYIAAVAYQTENQSQGDVDKGKINGQAPVAVGTANNNIDPLEFLKIPVRAIRDRALNGVYDILDPARGFRVKAVSFNSQSRPVLVWDVLPGKKYFIYGTSDLAGWPPAALNSGGWNADPGQWEMIFTDNDSSAGVPRFYRVEMR